MDRPVVDPGTAVTQADVRVNASAMLLQSDSHMVHRCSSWCGRSHDFQNIGCQNVDRSVWGRPIDGRLGLLGPTCSAVDGQADEAEAEDKDTDAKDVDAKDVDAKDVDA